MKSLNPFQKLIAVSVFSSLVVLGLIWLFWWLVIYLEKADKELAATENKITFLFLEIKGVMMTQDILAKRAPEVKRLNGFLVNGQEPVDFIEYLENLGKTTNNRIFLTLEKEVVGREREDLFFRVRITGTLENTRKYFELLELAPHTIQIEGFRIETSSGGEMFSVPLTRGKTKEIIPTHNLFLSIRVQTI